MLTGICTEAPAKHIFALLGWRHTRPLVPGHPSDSDDTTTEQGMGRTPNDIDRAVWSEDYVHYVDSRLKYNQPADT